MNNYAELKDAVIAWLNREGFADLVAQVDTFLAMAQRKIFWECNFRSLEAQVTATTDVTLLPSDFLRVKALYILDGGTEVQLKGASPQQVRDLRAYTPGKPEKYYLLGSNIVFGPAASEDYTYVLEYYRTLPLLSEFNTTNWFITACPELLLYGALVSASIFLKDDARKQVWEEAFQGVKQAINNSEDYAGFESGGLQVTSVS